ncbi:hypothetical protein [Pyrococcus sp. ST04]|uniref:hypothetical protein n=1 Tax=Pyrococcus sp. ST04 TaxID=1183377 RepID=UPI00026058D0|nr:hypothetical protein [Pyrococcus sp. ST04]AFK22224.1 hypothetical protein Py04_0622 [Pyrococcus sp. ST04]
MDRVLLRYYALTIPHVTIFAGALFGILLLIGVDLKLAVGIFATVYGLMLLIIALIVRQHFWDSQIYKLSLLAYLGLLIVGILVMFSSIFAH